MSILSIYSFVNGKLRNNKFKPMVVSTFNLFFEIQKHQIYKNTLVNRVYFFFTISPPFLAMNHYNSISKHGSFHMQKYRN